MPLVDSQRLAAFRLGFHVRQLRSILGEGIKGILFHPVPDVHPCRRAIEDAALVLASQFTSMESDGLRTSLHQAGELHDLACGARPEEDGESERVALGKLERDTLDRIDFLITKVGRKNADLAAWLEVGTALADLRHKVSYVYEEVPIPPEDWEQLKGAVDQLPDQDRRLAGSFLFTFKFKTLNLLGVRLREAYDDLCQCLASPDPTLTQAERVPTPPEPSVDVSSASGCVVLRGQRKSPLVLGKPMPALTSEQYDVVKFLILAGDDGVTKDQLENDSRHGDARRILSRLRASNECWAQVILMAVKRGGRYRIW
jgi:hypothetical protein